MDRLKVAGREKTATYRQRSGKTRILYLHGNELDDLR